jgi:hypothetical protein
MAALSNRITKENAPHLTLENVPLGLAAKEQHACIRWYHLAAAGHCCTLHVGYRGQSMLVLSLQFLFFGRALLSTHKARWCHPRTFEAVRGWSFFPDAEYNS